MVNIYNYLNFRDYLFDFYREKKSVNPSYSYQVLANVAGFKSKSFIADVIDGKKNCSEASVFALRKVLGFSDSDFAYFKNLVSFNQARSHAQKNHFFKLMVESNYLVKAKLVLSDNYAFYSEWYHNTVRELITIFNFKDNFALLARKIKPAISERKARQSVELLLKLGFIVKKNDRYEQADSDITTGDTVSSLAIENFHLQNLNLAGESIDSCSGPERDISCLIAALSKTKFELIKKELQDFRKKLVTYINQPEESAGGGKRVYHINMQLFPTSETIGEGNENE
jgi:uncharacterized protein (TIGR02147 family)